MSVSTMPEVVNEVKRKRARASRSPSSGEEGKKRGRPRVEKQDESAADRRRTQIRMAQRAYRQRKESTLEELRKRVSELTNTLELMNKAFVDCRDHLSAALPDSYLIDLRETSEQYENLMEVVRNPQDAKENPVPHELTVDHRTSETSLRSQDSKAHLNAEVQNVPMWLDQTTLAQPATPTLPAEISWSYALQSSEPDNAMSIVDQPIDYITLSSRTEAVVPAEDRSQTPKMDIPDFIPIPTGVDPPKTYSFQETSFARRLHRAALEAGYYTLLDPKRRPQTYERVFRLSMMGKDRNKLIAAIKNAMDRGPHEPLDIWEAPLIHVGGAGTHYPRKDAFGNKLPKKESYHLGIIGPQALALLEHAAQNNLSTDMTVEIAGFEGEWFDPYDVEGYLEEKGIFIESSSSFAEAEIIEWPSTPGGASSSTHSDLQSTPPPEYSTHDRVAPFNYEQTAMLHVAEADASKWDDLAHINMTGVGYSDTSTGSWMNFLNPGDSLKSYEVTNAASGTTGLNGGWYQPVANDILADTMLSTLSTTATPKLPDLAFTSSSNSLTASPAPRKRSVIIDVAKFVKVLILSAVCLGRAPGFKRRDVDRALAIASFDV